MRTTAPTPDQPGRWIISRFGPPNVLEWHVQGSPSGIPGPGKALIRILVAGIAGPDNIQRAGGYPNVRCRSPGFTPGYDLVGEIVAVGDNCGTLAVGDRVASMCMIGAHATHIELNAWELLPLEPTDDVLSVCALPLNYMTAFGMLRRSGANLLPGSKILVGSAAGGIGTAIAQLVKAFEMDIQMIGSCSPKKFDYVRALGMKPVDRRSPRLWEEVRSMTTGRGVDVAYDAVGSTESLDQSLRSAKDGTGQVVVIGIMGDIASDGSRMTTTKSADELLGERMGPRMAYWGVERSYYQDTHDMWRQDFYAILNKVRPGALKPTIARVLPLSAAIEAHELLVHGAGVKGKMLFAVDADIATQCGCESFA